MKSQGGKREEGYALLSVVWLLLLAAALVSAMLYGAMSRSRTFALRLDDLETQLALDGLADTIVGSRMIEGAASPWWRAQQRDIEFDGQKFGVTISPETDRLDVNAAPSSATIKKAIEAGMAPANARAFALAVGAEQRRGRITHLSAVTTGMSDADAACIDEHFTVVGGRAGERKDASIRQVGSVRVDLRSPVGSRRLRLTPDGQVARYDRYILPCVQ